MNKESIQKSLSDLGFKGGWLSFAVFLVSMFSKLQSNVETVETTLGKRIDGVSAAFSRTTDAINKTIADMKISVQDGLDKFMASVNSELRGIVESLNLLETKMDKGLKALGDAIQSAKDAAQKALDLALDNVGKRFDALQKSFDDRFDTLSKAFDDLAKSFTDNKADILKSVASQVDVALRAAQDNVRKWITLHFVKGVIEYDLILAKLETGAFDAGAYVFPIVSNDNDLKTTGVVKGIPIDFMPEGEAKDAALKAGDVTFTLEARHGDTLLVNYDGTEVTSLQINRSLVNVQIADVTDSITKVSDGLTARLDDNDAQLLALTEAMKGYFPNLV